jgi:PAS domain S-box-containing protein
LYDDVLFQLFVDAVEDYAVFVLDLDGNVKSWNIGAERLYGYTCGEILGKSFSRFYPAEDLKNDKRPELEVAIRDGRFENTGWRVRKDGSKFWANGSITALSSAHGKLQGFVKVTQA